MSITLAPITVRAYRPVALPNGNAVIVDPRESSVLLETYSPQNPDTMLMSEALNYEQYAQMRAENPDIAFPELVKPVPADQQGQDSTQAQQGRIQPNNYPQPGPIGNTTGIIVPKTSAAPAGAPGNPSGGAETEAESGWWKSWGSAVTHGVLDVVGLVPVLGIPADLTNAAIYAAEREYVDAGLSAAAAIPFFGWGATAVKRGRQVGNAVDATRAAQTGTEAAVTGGRQGAEAVGNASARNTGSPSSTGGRVDGNTPPNNRDGQANRPCAC